MVVLISLLYVKVIILTEISQHVNVVDIFCRCINAGLFGCLRQRSRPNRVDTQKLSLPPHKDFITIRLSSNFSAHMSPFHVIYINLLA